MPFRDDFLFDYQNWNLKSSHKSGIRAPGGGLGSMGVEEEGVGGRGRRSAPLKPPLRDGGAGGRMSPRTYVPPDVCPPVHFIATRLPIVICEIV